MMVLEMYLFSTMAILGIHVSVRGDIYSGMIRLFFVHRFKHCFFLALR